jgi:hypothetical protein
MNREIHVPLREGLEVKLLRATRPLSGHSGERQLQSRRRISLTLPAIFAILVTLNSFHSILSDTGPAGCGSPESTIYACRIGGTAPGWPRSASSNG